MFQSAKHQLHRARVMFFHRLKNHVLLRLLVKRNYLYCLNCVFPKKLNLWLAGAWLGKRYDDNPRYLFEYVLRDHPEIQILWVAFNQDIYRRVRGLGKPVVYAYSLRGIWLLLRAKVYLLDNVLREDIAWFGVGEKTFCMQLWHGSPLKRINYDSIAHRESYDCEDYRRHLYLNPYDVERYDAVLAPSRYYQEILRSAFRLHCRHFPILGYPRIDRLLSGMQAYSADAPKILYAPTFRGVRGTRFALDHHMLPQDAQFERLDRLFSMYHAKMEVQYHPTDTVSPVIEGYEHISPVAPYNDFYSYLGQVDILITDYSSVMLDFLLTKKPVICVISDIDTYVSQHRELYRHPSEVPGVHVCKTWDDVYVTLEKFFRNAYEGQPSQELEQLHEIYAFDDCFSSK